MNGPSAPIQPVCAIVGADRFLRDERLHSVLAQLSADADPLGPSRLSGESATLADALDEVRTMSLLGDRRVVVLDDADDFISKNRPALERYCGDPCPSGVLVFLCDSLPRNTRLYKIINEKGTVIVCEPPRGRAVDNWIIDRAQRVHGKRIGGAAVALLREVVGDEPGRLDTELAKLAAYVGDRAAVTGQDVHALSGLHREEKVFAVTDAMAGGDVPGALDAWDQVLLTDRAAPQRAVAGLAFGARRLLDALRDWEGGASIAELARRLYTDPGTAERRLKRATTAQLERQQHDLLTADLDVKTGRSTIDLAIQRFIIRNGATWSAGGGTA